MGLLTYCREEPHEKIRVAGKSPLRGPKENWKGRHSPRDFGVEKGILPCVGVQLLWIPGQIDLLYLSLALE